MISPSGLLFGNNLRPLPFKCLVCHQKCLILASCCLFVCLFVGKLSVISCLFVCLRVLKQSRAFTVLLPCLPLLARCRGTESANIKCNEACIFSLIYAAVVFLFVFVFYKIRLTLDKCLRFCLAGA